MRGGAAGPWAGCTSRSKRRSTGSSSVQGTSAGHGARSRTRFEGRENPGQQGRARTSGPVVAEPGTQPLEMGLPPPSGSRIACAIVPSLLQGAGSRSARTFAPSERSSSTAVRTQPATAGSARSKSSSTTPIRSPCRSPAGSGRYAGRERLQQQAAILRAPRDRGRSCSKRPRRRETTPVVRNEDRGKDGAPSRRKKQAGMRISSRRCPVPRVPGREIGCRRRTAAATRAAADAIERPGVSAPAPKCGARGGERRRRTRGVFSFPRTTAPAARRPSNRLGPSRGRDVVAEDLRTPAVVRAPGPTVDPRP